MNFEIMTLHWTMTIRAQPKFNIKVLNTFSIDSIAYISNIKHIIKNAYITYVL